MDDVSKSVVQPARARSGTRYPPPSLGLRRDSAQAVRSTYIEGVYGSASAWKQALATSSVRLQWDPDHDPNGNNVERRAIQLGLRGAELAQYSREWIINIEDISAFAHEQHQHVKGNDYVSLETPLERVYPVADAHVIAQLGIVSNRMS